MKLGCDGGVGEENVHGTIEKDSIQPFEGWCVAHVGPRVSTVSERQLEERQLIHSFIEQGAQVVVNVVVVFVSGASDEVKIASKHPGTWYIPRQRHLSLRQTRGSSHDQQVHKH